MMDIRPETGADLYVLDAVPRKWWPVWDFFWWPITDHYLNCIKASNLCIGCGLRAARSCSRAMGVKGFLYLAYDILKSRYRERPVEAHDTRDGSALPHDNGEIMLERLFYLLLLQGQLPNRK